MTDKRVDKLAAVAAHASDLVGFADVYLLPDLVDLRGLMVGINSDVIRARADDLIKAARDYRRAAARLTRAADGSCARAPRGRTLAGLL